MADNKTLGGLWGTIKGAFSEYGQAKKEEAKQGIEAKKQQAQTLIRETKEKAKEVKKEAAETMKNGAKKTLSWFGRGLAIVKDVSTMAFEATKAAGRVTAQAAKDFKDKSVSKAVELGGKAKAGLEAGGQWLSDKANAVKTAAGNAYATSKEVVGNAYTSTKEKATSVIAATKEGAQKVGHATLEGMKAGAKFAGKAVVYTVAAPVIVVGQAGYSAYKGAQKVGRVVADKARDFKNGAVNTGVSLTSKAKAGLEAGGQWLSAKANAAKTAVGNAYTTTKEAVGNAYTSTKARAVSVIAATKEGAQKVGNTIAGTMKEGAKKTLSGIGTVARVVKNTPTMAWEATKAAGRVTMQKATQLKDGAVKTAISLTNRAKTGLATVGEWLSAKVSFAKTGLTNTANSTKTKAVQFMQGAKRTIAGSQAFKNAKEVSGKIAGAVMQGYDQQGKRNAATIARLQSAGRGM